MVTDHRALTWLYSFKEPDGLLARWIEKLGQFDLEIKHEAGKTFLMLIAYLGYLKMRGRSWPKSVISSVSWEIICGQPV